MKTRVALLLAATLVGGRHRVQRRGVETPAPAATNKTVKLTIFAASSLTDAFSAEAAAFAQKTGDQTTFSFAGSQELVAQLRQGAPADVVATADLQTMLKVPHGSGCEGLCAQPSRHRHRAWQPQARHRTRGPRPVRPRGGARCAVSARREVRRQSACRAHVTAHPKSLEDNVRGVLTKVSSRRGGRRHRLRHRRAVLGEERHDDPHPRVARRVLSGARRPSAGPGASSTSCCRRKVRRSSRATGSFRHYEPPAF